MIYIGVILATIKLRKIKPAENSFVIPGGVTIPILALLATSWFLSNLAIKEIIGGLVFLVIASVIYFLMKATKK